LRAEARTNDGPKELSMLSELPGRPERPRATPLPLAGGAAPAAGSDKKPPLREVDENGDVIFRFKLRPAGTGGRPTLTDVYRDDIRDLLKVVRFFFRGAPVIVDAFAFLNAPNEQIRILDGVDRPSPAGDGPAG
jgi:hypothetical protein